MKKLQIVLLVLAAVFFVSCREKKSENGKITLTVWESSSGPDEFIVQAGEAYSNLHPEVEIKYVNVELADALGQIALDGPAGKGPDVFASSHDRLSSLVSGGHVLPAGNPELVKEKAFEACSSALTYDGVIYGYPVSTETVALFYNKKLMGSRKVPSTFEELADFSREFNRENPGKYGFKMNTGEGYYTVMFTTAEGNRLFGKDGNDRKNSYINSPAAVKGMKYFQSLREILDVPATDLDTATVDAAFQSGTAAMHITGLWNVMPFLNGGIEFGVAPIPSLPGEKHGAATFCGVRTMFVSAYSDHPKEADDFAAFLMSDEMQQLRFKCTGALPGVDVPVEGGYLEGFMKQLENSFPMPSVPEMGLYWEAMNSASKNIWNGADVQKELDACNAAITGGF